MGPTVAALYQLIDKTAVYTSCHMAAVLLSADINRWSDSKHGRPAWPSEAAADVVVESMADS